MAQAPFHHTTSNVIASDTMTSPAPATTQSSPPDSDALQAFIEKLRRSFSHDVRTPLGTIVNYASILEEDTAVAAEQVRTLAERIRFHAMRTSEMLRFLIDAMVLATRPLAPRSIAPAALLQTLLAELGSTGTVRSRGEPTNGRGAEIEVDPQLVNYVWQAFLMLERGLRTKSLHDAEIEIARTNNGTVVEMALDSLPDERSVVALDRFVSALGERLSPECRVALVLGCDLIVRYGGELELFGRPGEAAGIRLRLPQPA
jgi:K+-sensing histidine kinase KdpD